MAKIQLGSAPKTFAHTVKFPLVTGGEGEIRVQYTYRTRAQFAEFIDSLYPEIKAPKTRTARGVDVQEEAGRMLERDVRHIMGSVTSWDLDDTFDAANVKRLADEFPGAAAALIEDYARAINEGRTGN